MRSITLILLWGQFAVGYITAGPSDPIQNISLYTHQNQTKESEVFEFEIKKGMVFVQAFLNGEKGSFILDTGAPEIIINTPNITFTQIRACGIGGEVAIRWRTIKHFAWAGIEKKNVLGMEMDLKHLERITGLEIKGILGYSVLKHFDLFLDYENRRGKLEKGNPARQKEEAVLIIPFQMMEHLPVIKTRIGKRMFYLGLDTGAGVNVLDKRKKRRIEKENHLVVNTTYLTGLSSAIDRISSTQIICTSIRDQKFENMRYVFADISALNAFDDFTIDGLLGYPFLKKGRFTISYRKQKIYVWAYSEGEFTAWTE